MEEFFEFVAWEALWDIFYSVLIFCWPITVSVLVYWLGAMFWFVEMPSQKVLDTAVNMPALFLALVTFCACVGYRLGWHRG